MPPAGQHTTANQILKRTAENEILILSSDLQFAILET